MNTNRNTGVFPLLLITITLSLAVRVRAQTETVLHNFAEDANGYNPVGALTFDSAGNLWGTTSEGGNYNGCATGCGVVFELTPGSGGNWSENVPYTFAGGRDGANPFVGLTPDGAGNFYGATGNGGDITKDAEGYGGIFKLSPSSGGGWTKTIVHNFTGGRDGGNPYGLLILDSSGNLYGTAHNGGNASCDCGLVFKFSYLSGSWHETLLHTFAAKDGAYPQGGLVSDAAGNLYGTTSFGGRSCTFANCGVGEVFEVSPVSGGLWKFNVLYQFTNGGDGAYPEDGVTLDAAGNLFGTTQDAGSKTGSCAPFGCGVVFELSPRSGGGWKETTIHAFDYSDGEFPLSAPVFDASGNLYGTTNAGGSSKCGAVYKLTPASGAWTDSTIWNFTCGDDGGYPQAGLILGASGNLYGTTLIGGTGGYGVVFELTP